MMDIGNASKLGKQVQPFGNARSGHYLSSGSIFTLGIPPAEQMSPSSSSIQRGVREEVKKYLAIISDHSCYHCQMIDLANTLTAVQIDLQRLAARLEETEIQRSRYEDLQNSYDEAVNSAKWLRVQNADLEHKVEQHKPELANALSAREAAFKKLKHARKVIRDLLEERVGYPFKGCLKRLKIGVLTPISRARAICRVPEAMILPQKTRYIERFMMNPLTTSIVSPLHLTAEELCADRWFSRLPTRGLVPFPLLATSNSRVRANTLDIPRRNPDRQLGPSRHDHCCKWYRNSKMQPPPGAHQTHGGFTSKSHLGAQ